MADFKDVVVQETNIHTAKLVVNGDATSTDEATKAIDDAYAAMHKALDKLTEVKCLLAQCTASIVHARDRIRAERGAALCSANKNYAWATFGLLGGLFCVILSYGITAGIYGRVDQTGRCGELLESGSEVGRLRCNP